MMNERFEINEEMLDDVNGGFWDEVWDTVCEAGGYIKPYIPIVITVEKMFE